MAIFEKNPSAPLGDVVVSVAGRTYIIRDGETTEVRNKDAINILLVIQDVRVVGDLRDDYEVYESPRPLYYLGDPDDGDAPVYEGGAWTPREGGSGVPGPEGPEGPQGPEGPEGPQGPRGDTGATGARGADGAQGPRGDTGAAGPGLASGGSAGQIPVKNSGTDYDTRWANPSVAVVNHGATAGTARPVATQVIWVGSVTPTNATSNDLLVRTA